MHTDDDHYGIEPRRIETTLGSIIVRPTTESDDAVAFPIPGVDDLAIMFGDTPIRLRLSLEPVEHYDRPVLSRGYRMDNVITFTTERGRIFGHVFIEDGHPVDHSLIGGAVRGDTVEIGLGILRIATSFIVDNPAIIRKVNEATTEIEQECLRFRAMAVRESARELEREADRLEDEASRLQPAVQP